MSKYRQNRFPKLVVVGSSNKKPRKLSPPAVAPALSRNLWYAGMARIWNFVRSYWVSQRPRGAAVLTFGRAAAMRASDCGRSTGGGRQTIAEACLHDRWGSESSK